MNRVITLGLRLILGSLFVFAGMLKILDPAQFATDIGNFRLLPDEWVNLVAIILPWIELVAGILLVVGVWVRPGALLVTVMMVVFLGAIVQALARGLDIHCGCFGTVDAGRIGLGELTRDSVLLVMAAWLCWRTRD